MDINSNVSIPNARSYARAVMTKFEELGVCIYYDGATDQSQFEARKLCSIEYVKGQMSILHEAFFKNVGVKIEKMEFLDLVVMEIQKLKRI